MRRIFAQARKELTQLLRDRLAVALALLLPVILLLLQTTAISLTVKRSPHHRAGPRSVAGVPEIGRRLSPVAELPRRLVAHGQTAGGGFRFQQSARRADHPGRIWTRDRARRRRHGADSGRRFGREYRANHLGRCGANRSRVQRGKRGSDPPAARHRRDPVVVQPEPLVAEILRPRNLRAGHVPFSAAAGDAGHVQGRRAEDDPAGLRLEHFRA